MDTRKPLNVLLDADLIAEVKIQAIREKRTVSEIVDELFRAYLARHKKAKVKSK